jgi:hypothetical protein
MDSMRSLNTSLPGTSPSKQQMPEPPEQLLSAFKAAALSVTKLYKTAAVDLARARSEGYQDALDELLAFLDKEDIGLTDGEGWRIRRWATERLDVESEDEPGQPERGSSPVLERTQSATQVSTRTGSPARVESTQPVIPPSIPENQATMLPPTGTFTFRSTVQYPQDADMGLSGLDISDGSRGQPIDATLVSHRSQSPSTSITITRPTRAASRHNSQATRNNARATNTLGRGAGQKRKINLGEFFDIGNLGHGKDGFGGGGKRGRFA